MTDCIALVEFKQLRNLLKLLFGALNFVEIPEVVCCSGDVEFKVFGDGLPSLFALSCDREDVDSPLLAVPYQVAVSSTLLQLGLGLVARQRPTIEPQFRELLQLPRGRCRFYGYTRRLFAVDGVESSTFRPFLE